MALSKLMNKKWSVLATILLSSIIVLSILFANLGNNSDESKQELFVGVTFGSNTTREAKLLIDKVKDYTNLFVVDSWDISANKTAMTEICDYAMNADLNVIVYFDFIFYNVTRNIGSTYNSSSWDDYGVTPWHLPWLNNIKEKWGDKFLGVYLYDEPGGNQIDRGYWGGNNLTRSGRSIRTFENVSNYSDAATRFISSINNSRSMRLLTNNSIPEGIKNRLPVFTSDYALYWFDYEAGYDTVFAEISEVRGTTSNMQQIAFCRGAANIQNKQWGVIIVMARLDPPYLEGGTEMLQNMITAYDAGAEYVLVFNFPPFNDYGALAREHFTALEEFWNYIHTYSRKEPKTEEKVAFVLPKDYGWGMRNPEDNIWGFWSADDLAPIIWDKMTQLIKEHDLKLDILYEDPRFDFKQKYQTIHYWNGTTS
jgi:hypothetical protein